MKNQLFILVPAMLALLGCQTPVDQNASVNNAAAAQTESPNYAAFDEKVEIFRSFIKAHEDEDLEALKVAIADTIKYSPSAYNGNIWLGKEEYVAGLQAYHENFDNIKFTEGIAMGDSVVNGMWSGSVFPEGTATNSPDAIRIYGTWTATHTESGKDIGVKWFGLGWINDAGQIAQFSEYFDVNGIAVQIAAE